MSFSCVSLIVLLSGFFRHWCLSARKLLHFFREKMKRDPPAGWSAATSGKTSLSRRSTKNSRMLRTSSFLSHDVPAFVIMCCTCEA